MNRKLVFIAGLALALPAVAAIAQDASARTVQYHSQDIVPIRAKVKYTTLIVVPPTEKIMEAATGDKDFWIVDVVGNFCFVHPAKQGISSNLNLITDKGNIYSFTLQDISASSAEPDLKVIIEPADRSSIVAASGPPQFVPAVQLEQSKQQGDVKPVKSAITKPVQLATTKPNQPDVAPKTTTPAGPPMATIDPSSGFPGTTVKVTPPDGSSFPSVQKNDAVLFLDKTATVVNKKWSEKEIDVEAPDYNPAGALPLPVTIVDGNGAPLYKAGPFIESPKPVATLNPSSGAAGTGIIITGNGFGDKAGLVTFGGTAAQVIKGGWSNKEIDVTAPDLKSGLAVDADVEILDADKNPVADAGNFREMPGAKITPVNGVASTPMTITGTALPETQGSDKVLFSDKAAGKAGTILSWNKTGIKVNVPDLVSDEETRDANRAKHEGKDKKIIQNERNKTDALTVTIVDENNQPVLDTTPTFTEKPPQWSDQDEKPFSIRFIGGYELGYQSAQPSVSDGFLAVYGRSLFLKDRFGPFYQIRLQTAPQASGTNGVVSVVTNPSGSITPQNLQTVGSAVDLSLGFEYQFPQGIGNHGETSLGIIAGGGLVTPLQANSINASFTMPAFGTVECTELQSRLGSVLSNPVYAGIQATTSNTMPATTYCYTNNTTGTPTNITTLVYASPNQPNFFPKYFVGLRAMSRFPGPSGLKQCDEDNPCERGYADFMMGQDASITGGTFQHMVTTIDSIYPLPVQKVSFLYLFGSVSERFHRLPPSLPPLVLTVSPASGPSSPPPIPNAAVLVLPLTQPDRDFYRIGIGVSLNQVFTAFKQPKPAAQ